MKTGVNRGLRELFKYGMSIMTIIYKESSGDLTCQL